MKNENKNRMRVTTEMLTWYIKNWADSAEFKGCSSILALCGLTDYRSEVPNFSYTHPLGNIQKTHHTIKHIWFCKRKSQN